MDEISQVAVLEFEFQLIDEITISAGFDPPSVDRDFDVAGTAMNRNGLALDHRFKHRPKLAAERLAGERGERGAFGERKTRRVGVDLILPFIAPERSAPAFMDCLDGLYSPGAYVADARLHDRNLRKFRGGRIGADTAISPAHYES